MSDEIKRARQSDGEGACSSYQGKGPKLKYCRSLQPVRQTARKSTGGVPLHCKGEERRLTEHKPNSKLVLVLESHLNLLSDVTFIVGTGNERIPCNRLILKARSYVFAKMFTEGRNQDSNQEVQLKDVCPEAFKQFLEFIYADKFELDNVSETLKLLYVAHKFDVKQLVSKCEDVLERKVSLDNALEVFQAAQTCQMENLMHRAGKLCSVSLSELQTHPYFPRLHKEALMFILKGNDLKMKEVDLFCLAKTWAEKQNDSTTVEQNLEHVLPLIRFPLMTLEEFAATVVPTKLLPPSTVVDIIIYLVSDSMTRKSLVETLGFRAQKRQPEDPTIKVPLHPEEEEKIKMRVSSASDTLIGRANLQVFGELKECIQLCHLQLQGEQLTRGIGLCGVSVHCPSAKSNQSSCRKFQIRLKSKEAGGQQLDLHCKENYTILLTMDRLLDQGEVEDIEFDNIIPLKEDTIYSIEIEEIQKMDVGVREFDLGSADFGAHSSNTVTVKIDNICQATLNVHRNKLQGFEQDDSDLPCPTLISHLAFEEL